MGSLPDGTLCVYCLVHEAYYIPDGCCGPLCGHCMDMGILQGYDRVFMQRLERWVRAKFWRLSPREPTRPQNPAEAVLHHPLLALHVSQFLVVITDGSSSWSIGDGEYGVGYEVFTNDEMAELDRLHQAQAVPGYHVPLR